MYVVGTKKNRLNEMVLLSTCLQNINNFKSIVFRKTVNKKSLLFSIMNNTSHHPAQTKKPAFQSLNMVQHIWSDDLYNKQSDKPEHQGLHYLITQCMEVDACSGHEIGLSFDRFTHRFR